MLFILLIVILAFYLLFFLLLFHSVTLSFVEVVADYAAFDGWELGETVGGGVEDFFEAFTDFLHVVTDFGGVFDDFEADGEGGLGFDFVVDAFADCGRLAVGGVDVFAFARWERFVGFGVFVLVSILVVVLVSVLVVVLVSVCVLHVVFHLIEA
jgi:hypothetical protein